jgi:uncharacterized Zn-binding protein involved in type VI secretion
MSAFMLHESASVVCLHSGQAKPSVTDQRVKVGGKKIVTQPGPYTVSGCSYPTPPTANGPCVTAMWTSAATKVKASGIPVLFKDSQATCAPTGTGLKITSTQTRVKVT